MVEPRLTKTQILFFFQEEMPLFSCFSHQELFKVVQSAQTRTVEEEEFIFMKGEPSDTFYIIYSGKIHEYAHGPNEIEMIVKERRRGDFFGEMGMLNGKPQVITAVAAAPCTLITISRSHFLSYVKRYPEISHYLLKIYSKRLEEAAERQIAHVYLDAASRLAYQLLKMEREEGGGPIEISQEDLAMRCGMVRQTVAKLLAKWKRLGWLDTQRGSISGINRQALEQILNFSSDAGTP